MNKKLYILLMAMIVATTACSASKSEETSSETVSTSSTSEIEENQAESAEDSESEDLSAFATSIASEFTDSYGFDATGEYSETDGIIITITADGAGEWLDHAWDEMKDSIDESYNTSKSTLGRAGTGDASLTYLVCDTEGVSYLRYVNGEVEDLANSSRQSVQE